MTPCDLRRCWDGSGSNGTSLSGVPILVALSGPDDVTARPEAEGDQPAPLQLCGGAS